MTAQPTTQEVDQRVLSAMRRWVDQPAERTPALGELAEALIDLRAMHRTNEGDVDWRGRSWEYRKHVGDLYEQAGVNEDDRHHIQTAVRYHVGNKLRERVPGEELESVDMLSTSPKDRLNSQRAMGSILLGQRLGSKALWRTAPDTERAWLLKTKALTYAVEQMEELDASKLQARARASVADHLAHLHERLERVVNRLE